MTIGFEAIDNHEPSDVVRVSEHLANEFYDLRSLLIKERERLGITQEMLAGIQGVPVEQICEFEAHDGDPRLSEVLWYAAILGVELSIDAYSTVTRTPLRNTNSSELREE